jgi:hypothetical protein
MTLYQIDIHHRTHTCPANPNPHPYDTRRTIFRMVPGGPCRRPVNVGSGDTSTVIACGRHLPADRQCSACQIVIVKHAVTYTFTGHDGPQPATTAGTAA